MTPMPRTTLLPALALATILALTLGQADPARPVAAATEPPRLAMGLVRYRLAGQLNEEPWRARAGHYGLTGDITVLPDGRVFILDKRLNALHELDAHGEARDLWWNPDQAADPASPWRWQRLDAGADGKLHVLSRARVEAGEPPQVQTLWRLDTLDGSGRRQASLELGAVAPERYVDVAAGADGRRFLVRTNGNVASRGDITYGIEVYGPGGEKLETLVPEQFYIPLTIDVGPDGSLYVVDQFPHTGQTPPPGKVDGVAVFGPDHAYRRTIRFSGASDVAVGADGAVFVSRNNELYRLSPGAPLLLYSGPTIQKNPYELAPLGQPEMFSVGVRPDGRPVASIGHCSVQGLLDLPAAGEGGPPGGGRLVGALDRPELRGPIHPWRVGASGDASLVLQARFEPAPPDEAGNLGAPYLIQRYTADPQTILRYQADQLQGQLGACGVWNQPWGVKDLALDGADLWTIQAGSVKRRAMGGVEPEGTFALSLLDDPLASPLLVAVSAEGGRAALLDAGMSQVILVDRDLRPLGRPIALGGALPTDVALHGDWLAVAIGGRVRVGLADGGLLPERWLDVPGPAAAVAFGPQGELVALTRDGWLARFAAATVAGERGAAPQALWRAPQGQGMARDLAVDGRGRVLVTWADSDAAPLLSGEAVDADGASLIRAGGVWIFQPEHAAGLSGQAPDAPPAPGSCVVAAEKWLEPAVVRPGEAVSVTLRLEGHCAPDRRPLDLAVVLDTSKSMANDYGLDRAKAGLLDLLARLEGLDARVAVITAGGQAGVLQPLGGASGPGRAELSVRLADLSASGGRDLSGALALAAAELARGADPAAPRLPVALVLTDGAAPAAPDPVGQGVQSLSAAGARAWVQLHAYRFISTAELADLAAGFGAAQVLAHEGPEAMDRWVDRLSAAQPFTGDLAGAWSVEDSIAAGMSLVPGSASPALVEGTAPGALRWAGTGLRQDRPLVLRYQVRVAEDRFGSWVPVDGAAGRVEATDGRGRAVTSILPRPALRVVGAGEVTIPWVSR